MSLRPSQRQQSHSQSRSRSQTQAENWLNLNGVDDTLDSFFRAGRVKSRDGGGGGNGNGSGCGIAVGARSGAPAAAAISSRVGGKKRKMSERAESRVRVEEEHGAPAPVAKEFNSARLARTMDKEKEKALKVKVKAKRAFSVFDNGEGLSAAATAKSRTESSSKYKSRQVLGDLTTTLQNSPQRLSTRGKSVLTSPSPKRKAKSESFKKRGYGDDTKNKMGEEEGLKLKLSSLDSDSDSDSEAESESGSAENDVPSRLQLQRLSAPNFGKTPFRRSLKKNNANAALPTPPASSMPPRRKLSPAQDECGLSSPKDLTNINAKKNDKGMKSVVQTPFTVTATITSTNQAYPTPTSIAIPRLRLVSRNQDQDSSHIIPASKLNIGLDSDSPLSSLSPLPASSSQVENQGSPNKNEEPERGGERESRRKDAMLTSTLTKNKLRKKEDEPNFFDVIPPSQTQYIHYSPTKQRHAVTVPKDLKGVGVKPLSLMVIPSSQPPSSPPSSSQTFSTSLSPPWKNPIRKPARIDPPGLKNSPLTTSSPRKGEGEGKDIRDETNTSVPNFVVPTSQDDEVEVQISLLDGSKSRTQRPSRLFNVDTNARAVLAQDRDKARALEESQQEPDQRQQRDAGEAGKGVKEENDKKETRLSESTQDRFINAMLDDLDRLVDEATAMAAKFVSPSQVFSRTAAAASASASATNPLLASDFNNWKRGTVDEGKGDGPNERERIGGALFMQSSVTEPDGDSPQWGAYKDEDGATGLDPFSLTHGALLEHLGLRERERERGPPGLTKEQTRNGSGYDHGCRRADADADTDADVASPTPTSARRTETQSSTTQPDTDEEDPFPTLPPASASVSASAPTPTSTAEAESTADKAAVDKLSLATPRSTPRQKHQDAQTEGRNCTAGAGAGAGAGCGQVGSSQTESSTESETESESENENESETQPDSEDGSLPLSFPMPELVSQDDTLDMRLLTPRAVLRAVSSSSSSSSSLNRARARARDASRFRRREDCSFLVPRDDDDDDNVTEGSALGGEQGDSEEEEDESMPSAVRDFLSMFSQTQE